MALVWKVPGSMIVICFRTQARNREIGIQWQTLIFQDGWSSMFMASVTPSNARMAVNRRDLISK